MGASTRHTYIHLAALPNVCIFLHFLDWLNFLLLVLANCSVHLLFWPGNCLLARRSLQWSSFCYVRVHSTVALDGTGGDTEETGSDRKKKNVVRKITHTPVLYFFKAFCQSNVNSNEFPLKNPGTFMEECV